MEWAQERVLLTLVTSPVSHLTLSWCTCSLACHCHICTKIHPIFHFPEHATTYKHGRHWLQFPTLHSTDTFTLTWILILPTYAHCPHKQTRCKVMCVLPNFTKPLNSCVDTLGLTLSHHIISFLHFWILPCYCCLHIAWPFCLSPIMHMIHTLDLTACFFNKAH